MLKCIKVLQFCSLKFIGKAQVFVNARLITTVDGSGLLSEDWGKSAKIGSKVDGHQLNGFVDEFYILTSALSEKEIGELVNACSYGKYIQTVFSKSMFFVFCLNINKIIMFNNVYLFVTTSNKFNFNFFI